MSSGLFWLLSLCGFAAVSLLCGILAWPQLVAVWPSIQDFFIYGSGTVTVQKYGHTITRTIENEVQFNGVQVHW